MNVALLDPQDDPFNRLIGSYRMGDLTDSEFRRAMLHLGISEHEIEHMIREFSED